MSSAACRTASPPTSAAKRRWRSISRCSTSPRRSRPPRPAVRLLPTVPCATQILHEPHASMRCLSPSCFRWSIPRLVIRRRQGHTAGAARSRDARSGKAIDQWAGGKARRQQQGTAALTHQIIEMEQRALRRAIRPLDDDRGRGRGHIRQVGHALALEVGAIDHVSARAGRPDPGEMGLAAAGRTAHRQRRRRPVGPAIDPGQRLAVAAGDNEILAGIGWRRQREFEGELIGHRPLSRHCRHGRSRFHGSGRSGGARSRRSQLPSAPRSGRRRTRTASRRPEGRT